MPLPIPFKLEKLRIGVYKDAKRQGLPSSTFEVMFNPETIQMVHENRYAPRSALNNAGKQTFIHTKKQDLKVKLIIDGTGVDQMGVTSFTSFATKSVSEQIESFLELCFYRDGSSHEPKYLKIEWGKGVLSAYNCRLKSVKIDYTAFERNGAPLRAELHAKFIQDEDSEKAAKGANLMSPDVTHARVVKYGDTLPLLCTEIYGSAEYYLQVAQVNQLDNFRSLTPGQTLIFPPLER